MLTNSQLSFNTVSTISELVFSLIKYVLYNHNYRVRKSKLLNTLTPQEWQQILNKFYNYHLTDIIGGKLYKKETIKKIPISCYTEGFDFEFMSRILKKKLKVCEMSINYKPRTKSAEKKIKFYHIINALYNIFKVKLFN